MRLTPGFRFALPFAAALTLGSCGLDESPADFRFLNLEPETIDPGRVGGQAGGRIVANLFEGLTVRAPGDLHPAPGIAESWEISADGRRWTFHLRPSTWSDGRPLLAEDFRWSWTRLLAPQTASKSAQLLFGVRGARAFNAGRAPAESLGLYAPDPQTFVVELDRPLPYFADLCASPPLCPTPRQAIERAGEHWTRPRDFVGNGPFVLEDWRLNQRMRLRRNPRYWNAAVIALECVDVVPGDFANANFNRYESGLLDWVDAGGVPPSLVAELTRRPDWHAGPFLATYFVRCNLRHPPLDDPHVRRALLHALDARAITEHVTRAGQLPATGLVPPGLPGYRGLTRFLYDPDFARTELAAAGFPGGEGFPPLTLLINTSEWHRQIAEVLQQQWRRELGIDIRLRNQEWKVFTANVGRGDYDLARGSWIGDYLDPNTFLEIFASDSGNNRTGFASDVYDSLLDLAAHTLDPSRRADILRRCEEIVVHEEAVILPIYVYSVTNLFDDTRWQGLEPDLLNSIDLRRVRPREAIR